MLALPPYLATLSAGGAGGGGAAAVGNEREWAKAKGNDFFIGIKAFPNLT